VLSGLPSAVAPPPPPASASAPCLVLVLFGFFQFRVSASIRPIGSIWAKGVCGFLNRKQKKHSTRKSVTKCKNNKNRKKKEKEEGDGEGRKGREGGAFWVFFL